MTAQEAIKAVNEGKFDVKIKSGRTELTAEEKAKLEQEKKHLQEEMEKRRAEYETKAKSMLKEMEGKENKKIRTAMLDAGIPIKIVDELAPAEKKEAGGAGGAKGGKK
jgi:ABC-type phosphate transport system auxiliary subunit